MGPFELNGKKYAGLVPMTPFGSMLKDDEVAAVREAIQGQQGFYMAEDLLKEHPME
jgi:hypothetical protein